MSSDRPTFLCPHCDGAHTFGAKFCPVTGKSLTPWWAHWRIWGVIATLFVIAGGLWWVLHTPRNVSDSLPLAAIVSLTSSTTGSALLVIDTPVSTRTPVSTSSPTSTLMPSYTPTQTATTRPTVTPTPLVTQVNETDGAVLVFVPAGDFLMGSDHNTDPYFWGAEGPQHTVYLDAFWIYRTEVTNAMYQQCVEVQACPRPAWNHSNTRSEYYKNPTYDDYPVIYVSWVHATSYCKWAEGRLPTEAEWEKAARGTDSRLFPWGDASPSSQQANFRDSGYRDAVGVGTYPGAVSIYGALDMAGNVWEWTFDWFQSAYYDVSPYENPLGPATGSSRVMRGGSWHNTADGVRTVVRASIKPNDAFNTLGFRCAQDIP